MSPDFDRAAILAMETLISNSISATPIDSLSILLKHPGVRVISFTRFAAQAGMDRHDLVPLFGENQDAATFRLGMIEGVEYIVVYNLRLPYEIIWRGVARELGHIILGHDGVTRPADVRMAEAMCFAHHLISPRPIIHMLQEAGPLTMAKLTDTTGCSDDCVEGLRNTPGVHVPAELNRKVRDQFSRDIREYIRFSSVAQKKAPALDLGSYMDFYEE